MDDTHIGVITTWQSMLRCTDSSKNGSCTIFIAVAPQRVTCSNCGLPHADYPIDYNTQRARASVPANEATLSSALFQLFQGFVLSLHKIDSR